MKPTTTKHPWHWIIIIVLMLGGLTAITLPIGLEMAQLDADAKAYDLFSQQVTIHTKPQSKPSNETESNSLRVVDGVWFLQDTPQTTEIPLEPLVDFATCLATNKDFIGWLQIADTPIDYPVVQSDDIDYCLNHTFAGKESYLGTLFSLEKTDFQKPSQNIAIYGHHIRSSGEKMFKPLIYYKDQAYFEEHPIIRFDSLYHQGNYRVFAVINILEGDWEPSTASFGSSHDFENFIQHARSQALYQTDVAVDAHDEILTLITCDRSYSDGDGRLVIMAVKQTERDM